MANGKIVKYKKVYKVILEGKSDTVITDSLPTQLVVNERVLRGTVDMLNRQYKWHNATIKEIKR